MLFYLAMIETEEDKRKFERIYLAYKQTMFYTANRILKNVHTSEDAVHQAFESYFTNSQSAYGNRVSLKINVTQSNINTINTLISNNDKWALTNNCSSFAPKFGMVFLRQN